MCIITGTCVYISIIPTQVVKDIFLLGRGELFLSFIDMADILLKQLPTATTQHGL